MIVHQNEPAEFFNPSSVEIEEQLNKNLKIHEDTYMNVSTLENFVEKVGLPKDSVVYFEMELLRQRLCSSFKRLQWFKYYDEELDSSESEDYPTDEDDSDLEYW